MKTFLDSPASARHYVEADRVRADDYYLAEDTGVVDRYVAAPGTGVQRRAPLSGDGYEAWVAGVDPDTGVPKGRLRNDAHAVRFVEVTVNGPRSWSLAAELHPDISAAYEAAQDRAAAQIIGWLARHATTRVGSRGAQVQVPVQRIEAVTVRHRTSRAGDPHRHLHLQINARVFATGQWRGLHTVGVRDSLDAINGIGHAAVAADPQFRAALAEHGFTLDTDGEIVQLAPFVGAFSARAAQIGHNIERYEAAWRAANPGQEPDARQWRTWDARAWADGRRDKVVPRDGSELTRRWVTELHALGYREQAAGKASIDARPVGALDRDAAAREVLTRLAARRSGWNAADIRGEVEQLLARSNIVTDEAIRAELAEDLTARTLANCVPLLDRDGVPEHLRALTSRHVLDVEADLTTRFAGRAAAPSQQLLPLTIATDSLDSAQRGVVTALAGDAELLVIEGAAGAGKTTTLAAARAALEQHGARLRVVTPTLKAARVAARQVGADASSAARLAYQHGFRWDEHGHWTRLQRGATDPHAGRAFRGLHGDAALRRGDVLLVDEAGMLDQDTARALLTIADEHSARIALLGDRHQLPAVGRGGVLDLAVRWAAPDTRLSLDSVHRFARTETTRDGKTSTVRDEEYARLSLALRDGTNPAGVFEALLARGQIRLHTDNADRIAALAAIAADAVHDAAATVVVADTREQVAQVNTAIRERLVAAGDVNDSVVAVSRAGQRIGAGDRVMTRRNDPSIGVANRDTWKVTTVASDGALTVRGEPGERTLPAGYVAQHIELGYATTVHGVQGDTATTAHAAIGVHSSAASAYVALTRGRETNVAHLVAESVDDARAQWVAVFVRDRADLGPAHAAQLAATEAANYAHPRPLEQVIGELRATWTAEQNALERIRDLEPAATRMHTLADLHRDAETVLPALAQAERDARAAAQIAAANLRASETVIARDTDRLRDAALRDWDTQQPAARAAAETIAAGPARLGHRRAQRAAVTQAHATLHQWAETWQRYGVTLPTDPDALARHARWFADRPAVWEQLDRWARHQSEHVHPELQQARAAAEHARTAASRAGAAYRDASQQHNNAFWRHGPDRYTVDPAARAADLDTQLAAARDQLTRARADITALTSEPALLARPADRLTNEHARWQHDRTVAYIAAEAAAAARQARAAAGYVPHDPAHDQPEYQPISHDLGYEPGFGR